MILIKKKRYYNFLFKFYYFKINKEKKKECFCFVENGEVCVRLKNQIKLEKYD